jgi:hypothetical protein
VHRACGRPDRRASEVGAEEHKIPPATRRFPKWMWACVTVPVPGGVVPTSE